MFLCSKWNTLDSEFSSFTSLTVNPSKGWLSNAATSYNRAMVCSAEVLKARSGIRNGVAVLVYYSTKLTGSFQNTILQSDPLRLGDLTIACCWMIYNFVTKTVLSLAI